MAPRGPSPVVGIDAGGTFTDVVVRLPSGWRSAKVPSTPSDPSLAVARALEAIGGLPKGGRVHHGTTVATNTLLTRTGARVALVATAGFEDLLHVGRGHRVDLHALSPTRVPPLVERRRTVGLAARADPAGRSLRAPSGAALAAMRRRVAASGAEAVAVSLLHATASSAHEPAAGKALERLGLPVSLGHRLSADPREVERTEATVLDAYVGGRMRAYLARLSAGLPKGALSVLTSDGARETPAAVSRAPVRTLLSGPAAGVVAAHALARAVGASHALSFDVGGTSTDVAWIESDALSVSTAATLAGFSTGVPSLDVHSVGAGGGSIATIDAGGALRVGPSSAGADPGPACYGRGGPFTVSDAMLLLGRLPNALLDGAFPLDVAAALASARPLARRARLTVLALCLGVAAVAEAATARAVRFASAAAGRDPRGAILVAFGGAGGLLAASVARALSLSEVVVPWSPGTFAAQGARLVPARADASRAVVGLAPSRLPRIARDLARAARRAFSREHGRPAALLVEADARYAGQAFELTVLYGPDLARRFHARHLARHGYAETGRAIEVVRLRARALGPVEPFAVPKAPRGTRRGAGSLERRPGIAGSVRVVSRDDLAPRARVLGPAVVEESGATTFVPRGFFARAAPDGTLRVRAGGAS